MILKIYNDVEILIDQEDVERVLKVLSTSCMWRYNPTHKQVYGLCKTNKGKRYLHLSRVVMQCYDVLLEVDHKNHNRFDYRKSELRVCSRQENSFNRRKTKSSTTSKYKGVSFYKLRGTWTAQIQLNGKSIYLGRYTREEDAALMYNIAAIKYHGSFASLNIIEQ